MVDFFFKGWRPTRIRPKRLRQCPMTLSTQKRCVRIFASTVCCVTRPDVDLPDGASLYSDAAYEGARHALNRLDDGVITQDGTVGYYAHAHMGAHVQTGIER